MNLEHIKTFVHVYKSGSFAAAAKDMNVAASSVSRAVATLERQLKIRLFQRTTRSLKPTQEGEAYFLRVESLLEELECAQNEISAKSSELSGHLRITASTSFAQTVLAPLLARFYKLHPGISIEMTLSDTQSNIVDGQFDLAVRHGKLGDSSLIARKLLNVNYFVVATPDYLRDTKPIQHPRDLLDHTLLTLGYPAFQHEWLFRQKGEEAHITIQASLSCSAGSSLKTCVMSDMGIALLPDWLIEEELAAGEFVHVLPTWTASGTSPDSSIWLLYPSRSFVPAKTTALINHLLSNIGAQSSTDR